MTGGSSPSGFAAGTGRPRWLGLALIVVAALLAVLIFRASWAIGLQTRAPQLVGSSFLVPTALAQANRAYSKLAQALQDDPAAWATPDMAQRAAAAYASEPLSAAALAVAAMQAEPAERSQAIAVQGGKLTRRLTLISNMLFVDALGRGDLKNGFAWLDRAAKVNSEARSVYVDALATSLAAPDAVDALEPLVGARPSWERVLWSAVRGKPASLANAARLRVRLAGDRWAIRQIEREETGLVAALVAAGQYDAAQALFSALLPRPAARARAGQGAGRTNLLRDPLFRFPVDLAPLTWWRISDPDFDATPQRGGGVMLSTLPRTSGAMLEQLVRIPAAGSLAFGAEVDALPGAASGGRMELRLVCAAVPATRAMAVVRRVGDGRAGAVVQVPDAECDWYLVQLALNNFAGDDGLDIAMRSVALTVLARRRESTSPATPAP